MRFSSLTGLFVLFALWATVAGAQCGNGVIDPGEDCDDGGTCIGGTNAGSYCTDESQCQGDGVCVGGSKAETACTSDSDCPDGQCLHCIPQGGDGCAANCTVEHDVSFTGRFNTGIALILNGTPSGETFLSAGTQILTVGREMNEQIPVVIRATSVHTVPMATFGCACLRGVAARTCGGTVFEADGTHSPDCTPDYTAGDAVCAGMKPCTYMHGLGNSASGVVGCNGLSNTNLTLLQDWAGTTGTPAALISTLGGMGGPGSALLFKSTAVAINIGLASCLPNVDEFGRDGQFCTDDDPQSSRGDIVTAAAVTGTVTATATDVNPFHQNIGPVSFVGQPLNCDDLTIGSAVTQGAMVTGTTQLNAPSQFPDFKDRVVTEVEFVPPPSATASPTGTVTSEQAATLTPTVTPTPSRTPLPTNTATPPFSCVGDCNGDHQVTVDEILTMVNIALGDGQASDCANGIPRGAQVDVAWILQAVNNALGGCTGSPLEFLHFDSSGITQADSVRATAADVDNSQDICPSGLPEPFTQTIINAAFRNEEAASLQLTQMIVDLGPNSAHGTITRPIAGALPGGRCNNIDKQCASDGDCPDGPCTHTETTITGILLFDIGDKLAVNMGTYNASITFFASDSNHTFETSVGYRVNFDNFDNCPGPGG